MNAFTSVEAGTPVSADAIGLPALADGIGLPARSREAPRPFHSRPPDPRDDAPTPRKVRPCLTLSQPIKSAC